MITKRLICATLLILSVSTLSAVPVASRPHHLQSPQTLSVEGAVEKPGEWTPAALAKEFANDVRTVRYTLKGSKATARCVPLLAILRAARPRLDSKVKNHLLAFVALVRAKDGYTVSFSMGELLPEYGNRAVWLALDRDGKPLPDNEAPVRLLVPNDTKPSRWVHGVTRILLLDGLQSVKQP